MKLAFAAALAAFVCAAPAARAQEAGLLLGRTFVSETRDSSYAWSVDYRQSITRHLAWSIAYLNEGHPPGHHRDGLSAQAWARLPLFDDRLWIAAGGGLYRYYDTQAGAGGESANVHDRRPIYSLSASYYSRGPLFARLVVNHVSSERSVDATTFLAGIGLRLGTRSWGALPPPERRDPGPDAWRRGQELSVFAGGTTVNTFASQKARARGIEFRHDLGRYSEWSITVLNEGSNELIRRNGVASQLWLVRPAWNGALRLGVGLGLYGNLDRRRPAEEGESEGRRGVAGIMGMSAAVRIAGPWSARLTWTRIVTDYSRDTDVYTLGAAVRF